MQHLHKIFFTCLFLLVFASSVTAQFSINLLLSNRPPSYLVDWSKPQAGQLIITYTSPGTAQVKLSVKIQDITGNTIASGNQASAQVLTVNNGTNIIRMDRVLQLENLQFFNTANSIAKSGKLPAGSYQLCVQLFSTTGLELSAEQCRFFTQVNYQLLFCFIPMIKVG